jgi:hypothetical protein
MSPAKGSPTGDLGIRGAMKLYADLPARRTRQVAGDLLLLIWILVWIQLAVVVHEATLALAVPGRLIQEAGTGLASRLRDAGARVGDLPVVGGDVRVPFDGAGDAARNIAEAGAAQVEAVQTLAFWLGIVVAAVPILVAVAAYVPSRWRFLHSATAAVRARGSSTGVDLLALRALTNQPMHRLAEVGSDPAGAWRRGDPDVVQALAALELREIGLGAPQ